MNTVAKVVAMKAHPIPDDALDDRFAFVGTSGSGKTYNAGTAIERLLGSGARGVIVDPLGVWWGLRSTPDGKRASPFKVVIFGGPHGDLPLTENAGALIGETAASMAESCILDLSEIGTAAGERRFVAAALRALYTTMKAQRVAGDAALLHLVLDEADMWAPQTIREKDGGSAQLFAITERIVRRGRIDGFIPWLITQRTAEISKSVLSMADGLVAMKLTAPQDRNALDAWISDRGDVEVGKRIKASLSSLQLGEGVIWIPGRGLLEERAKFPKKTTFDSSRAPKRGEERTDVKLKPLDLDALKGKLAKVEAEAVANDPAKLKAELARVKRELDAAQKHPAAAPPSAAEIEKARAEAFAQGAASRDAEVAEAFSAGADAMLERLQEGAAAARAKLAPPKAAARIASPRNVTPRPLQTPVTTRAPPVQALRKSPPAPPPEGISAPELKILEALAACAAMGIERPTREQLGAFAGYTAGGGRFGNLLGGLRSAGFLDYPAQGQVQLTDAGAEIAPQPDLSLSVRERLAPVLDRPQATILDALPADGSPVSREDLGAATGYEAKGGRFGNLLGSLRTLGVITYPSQGFVAVEPWVHQ